MEPSTTPSVVFDDKETGRIVREARKSKGIKQKDLAASMGIKSPYMYDLEMGKRPWTMEKFEAAKKAIFGGVTVI